MVENRARPVNRDRRVARRQTHRHHRIHRVRRHRARRAAAAQRARLRAGPARPRRQAHDGGPSGSQSEMLKNDAFDRLRAELRPRRRSTTMVASRITTIAGDVGTDGLGLDRRRPGRARRRATSSSTRPPRCRSTRRSTRRSRSTCSGRRASPTLLQRARRHAPPRRRVDVLRRRQPARQRARGARQRRPVRHRARLAQRGRRRPAACAATAEAASREPDQLVEFRADARAELGAAGAPALAAEDRAAPRALGEGPARRGRPGAGRQRRLARRLRLHQGARRAGADRRRRATCRSASCARRSSSRRWAEPQPGLDPRLPHGRAGDHLLRPRAAAASSPACRRARST